MKTLLKLEELAMFGFCCLVLVLLDAEWWWFGLMLIAPDISMLGYLVNKKIGAHSYNLFHHKGVAILVSMIGILLAGSDTLVTIGFVLFGHSSMDRFFGFGLKTPEGFKFTHLGKIGKEK